LAANQESADEQDSVVAYSAALGCFFDLCALQGKEVFGVR